MSQELPQDLKPMLEKSLLLLVLALGLLTGATAASAAPRKNLGLGVVIVDPTGLTAQYVYAKNTAAVLSLGWGDNSVHLNVDNLWLRPNLVKIDKRPIALYYGVGVRWLNAYDESKVGVRAPVGVQHIFREVPIQIFFEIAPTLNLIDSTSFDLDIALGARYFF